MKLPKIRFAILAVDVAVVTVIARRPHVLLMPVHRPPRINQAQALPGGLVRPDETAEDAAARHLAEKCELSNVYSEQLATFSAIHRDPSGRVVSVAYLALLPGPLAHSNILPDGLSWCEMGKAHNLAYDHDAIVAAARDRLRARLQSTTIARYLMPPQFTMSELQALYEGTLDRNLDKRNFRKKLIGDGIVRPTGKKVPSVVGPPSELYRFAGTKLEVIGIL